MAQSGLARALVITAVLVLAAAGCRRPPPTAQGTADAQAGAVDPTAAARDAGVAEDAVREVSAGEADAGDDPATRDAAVENPPGGGKGLARFPLCEGSESAGPVDMRHRKHQKQFACKRCHHEIQPGSTPAACGTCHGPQEGISDLQTSFHRTCTPCHSSLGMGPVKCLECHKWIKKDKAAK